MICYECSGAHRSLGTHFSFVQSLTMDKWTKPQYLASMRVGGNEKLVKWMKQFGEQGKRIDVKYKSFAASWYKDRIPESEGRIGTQTTLSWRKSACNMRIC